MENLSTGTKYTTPISCCRGPRIRVLAVRFGPPFPQVLKSAKQDMEWLQEEMEKSKYLEWLEGITDVVEESTASRRESATSAFWKALAARHDKVVFEEQQGRGQQVRHVKQRKDPMNQHLVHLGVSCLRMSQMHGVVAQEGIGAQSHSFSLEEAGFKLGGSLGG